MTFELFSAVLNILFGSGFVLSFIQLRRERKKSRAEGYKSEIDLVTNSVESMIQTQNKLMCHNQELINALTNSRRENAQLAIQIDELQKKINTMISTNREIVKILKKLNVDESVIKKLKDDQAN